MINDSCPFTHKGSDVGPLNPGDPSKLGLRYAVHCVLVYCNIPWRFPCRWELTGDATCSENYVGSY